MEKVETPLDVLSRAATMVQPCPAYPVSDSDSFETPSTASSGESEGDRTLSPETPRSQSKEATGKWRRERRSIRLPEYRPKENGKMALRSQSFNERRTVVPFTRAQPHSDGDLSDETDDGPANLTVNGKKAPPEYPGSKYEAPIDMRLRSRPAPPPYSRPSVITKSNDTPPGSMSMCDPVIDEHFRRSLGDDYMNLFKKNSENAQPGPKPNMKDRASSPILFKTEEPPKPTKIIAMEIDDPSLSVDDHFAKALGDTWRQLQTSKSKENEKTQLNHKGGVDDHFSKALGETWQKIQSSKHNLNSDNEKKDQTTKIITRSGVVI
ncbi:transcription cofactor vestigial-like protein 4 [Bombyx mandarina]|uniref:Transcription cofactor vestigial-like protein 4 n=2 Tax=Bombyx TaxID=7090 RepID=A0A8R2R7X1_BOMMO|nr:transcription cofactor vestigial-like protein 4 [Bombyx mandarina]XP_028038566.1 transcription cofactor vestigial-like protein 4 [Bombyx mandarina]XP_037874826.1 transcription cofactor vestigial-like protein 4 isoform X2 [Bombyx mori]XP_037874827.1 transcription cofactor vestigial-like protein 4 isoform X2 [Bombyx mori]XP_037874828.1 transcription cofactor vestigial-like protein 4 isoform X2 [Bombyx mori]